MRLTKSKLKQIIKEELENSIDEGSMGEFGSEGVAGISKKKIGEKYKKAYNDAAGHLYAASGGSNVSIDDEVIKRDAIYLTIHRLNFELKSPEGKQLMDYLRAAKIDPYKE